MVSRWIEHDVLQCTMDVADQSHLYPSAYFVDNHKLVPYEFCDSPVPLLSPGFTKEAVDYLESNDLDHTLAIGLSLPSTHPWIERELLHSAGTITKPSRHHDLGLLLANAPHMVNTEWLVQETQSGIVLHLWRACNTSKDGRHITE